MTVLYGPVDKDHNANRAFRRFALSMIGIAGTFLVVGAVAFLLWLASMTFAWPHDDGRYADDPLHSWFDSLASSKGLCCSFADGATVKDVDWDIRNGHYVVRLNHQWIEVPESAIVAEPNRFGPSVVWPYKGSKGETLIRCFLPGAGA